MVDDIAVERRTPFGDNPVVGARGAETQRRILSAALEVFSVHGYHDSRVEQITEAAGCSRPTFYQYFSSKEDVFRALASYVGRSVVQLTEALGTVTPDEEGREAVRAWMVAFASFYDEYASVFGAFSSAVRADAELAGDSGVVSAGFGKALRHHLDASGTSADPDVMASVVVTMIVRANLLRHGSVGLIARKRFVDSLAALVHRVLVGSPLDVDDGPASTRRPARLSTATTTVDAPPNGSLDGLTPQGRRMRQRLVTAGTVVFPRLGFHETRVDDIVTEAGASHGSFYRYFETKEELFQVIAGDAATAMIACLDRFPAEGDPDDLRAWLADWFATYARHGSVIALWREVQFSDPLVEDVTRRVADAVLGRLFGVLAERGTGDPLVSAIAFLGLIETVPHHVQAFGYYTEEQAIEALVAIVRRGFLDAVTGTAA